MLGWFSHLNLLHHLFTKGADLCRDADSDVFCSAVLTAHTVESTRTLLDVTAQVRLGKSGKGWRESESEMSGGKSESHHQSLMHLFQTSIYECIPSVGDILLKYESFNKILLIGYFQWYLSHLGFSDKCNAKLASYCLALVPNDSLPCDNLTEFLVSNMNLKLPDFLNQTLVISQSTSSFMYWPRTWRGRRHCAALFHTAPLGRPSSQRTCRKSASRLWTPTQGRCSSGSMGQCARKGVYTVGKERGERSEDIFVVCWLYIKNARMSLPPLCLSASP